MERTYNCPKCGISHNVSVRHGYRYNCVLAAGTNLAGTPNKTAIVCGILLLIFFSNVASAAHTFDTKAQYQTTTWSNANPGNLSFTAGSGASLMVLTIFTASGSLGYRTGGTPTFNGKSFSSLGRNQTRTNVEGSSEMWYLLLTLADTGSAHTVSVPNAATTRYISFHVSTFKSATGVSALDVNASKWADSPNSKNPNQSVTTTANGDVIVAGMFSGLQTAPTVTSPGTQIYSSAATNYKGMSQYYIQSSAGAQVLGWTSGTADEYSMQTAAFKEVEPTYIPPSPTSLSNTSGNFWINYTWSAGSGNVTNSYNVSVNGSWHNGTTTAYYNNSGLSPHGWSNISVYSFNSSGTGKLNSTAVSQNTHVANNPVTIGNVSGSYTLTAGNTLSIFPTSSDLDGDTPVFARNFTNGTFYTNNGTLLLPTTSSYIGIHSWQINVTDGFGSVSSINFTVNVTSTYSLDTTYTFTETNSSSTWQSISIKDSSFADALANVSILNFTSGRWESILTNPFTGGTSPDEHVNVIKGASGNASNYDGGSGQIKIRYNWTNSTSNNSLGVDMINVTVLYSQPNFLLNITTNTTSVPVDNQYYLEINYSRDANETYSIYVWNGSAWNNRTSLNATPGNWTVMNFTLNSGENNSGNPLIRYLDNNPSGTSKGNLYIDYQRIHGITAGLPSNYYLNITTNTTNVPQAYSAVLQLKYNISGDNFTVQIMNTSSGWENATILNITGMPYRNITLNSSWLIPDGTFSGNVASINRYFVNVRYIGVNQSVNGTLYLDYQRIYNI